MKPPRAGRPPGSTRVTEPRSLVAAWLTARDHDRLIALAQKEHGGNISRTIRHLLALKLPRGPA